MYFIQIYSIIKTTSRCEIHNNIMIVAIHKCIRLYYMLKPYFYNNVYFNFEAALNEKLIKNMAHVSKKVYKP